MPVSGCGCGAGLALALLLLLPAPYLVPELGWSPPARAPALGAADAPARYTNWIEKLFQHCAPVDIALTVALFVFAITTYLAEWIQRKIMERRIMKLNESLTASLERLRCWDTQQDQLEGTLKMVQNATTEYNLLLYLLLRQHRCLAPAAEPPAGADAEPPRTCLFDSKPMSMPYGRDDDDYTGLGS